VRVDKVNPFPLPIRSCPLAAVEPLTPVPPNAGPNCAIEERTPAALFVTTPADVNDVAVNPAPVNVPVVEILSPAVAGEIVDVPLFREKNPTVPEVFVVVILPAQVRAPVVGSTVHPVVADPPAISTSPLASTVSAFSPVVELVRVNMELFAVILYW